MQCDPNSFALRKPLHFPAGAGGFHRNSPIGGAANGIPRNARTPPPVFPSTTPLSIVTSGPVRPIARVAIIATTTNAKLQLNTRIEFSENLLQEIAHRYQKCAHHYRRSQRDPCGAQPPEHENGAIPSPTPRLAATIHASSARQSEAPHAFLRVLCGFSSRPVR